MAHYHSPGVATVASHAACASMSTTTTTTTTTTTRDRGDRYGLWNGPNYGYILKHAREINVAVYDAKLIFHLQLPDWQIEFDHACLNCKTPNKLHNCL